MVKDKLTSDGVLMLLHDMGIRFVQCNYSGGGDSGAIDEWGFYDETQRNLIDWESASFTDESATEEMDTTSEEMKNAWKKVEGIIYNVLNTKVNDWWNNDGGYGSFLMDVTTCEYIVANNCYVTEVESQTVTSKFESAE